MSLDGWWKEFMQRLFSDATMRPNYLPLKGMLPEDREKLLKAIDYTIAHPDVLKLEWMRGLYVRL